MSANFTPSEEDMKKIQPFKFWSITNFPFIADDFDQMTYYEILCKIVEYLNKVIENNNAIINNENTLYQAYIQLQNYVNNYFDNLDVQEEINNKLDEMAESGELADIVSELLMKGKIIFGKNSNNYLKSGDFCIIKTPSKVVMIDTDRVGNWTSIAECLQENEITHIDVLIITHFHDDHNGNITNLCSGGFVDSNTDVYAQAFNSGWMHDNNQMEQQFNAFNSCLQTYGFNYIIPDTENQTITVDSLLKIRFNNIDPSYWLTHYNGLNQLDYNDTSFILSITYGAIKFLNGGDAGKMPFLKMIEDGYITESYNLFKIEHHGIEDPRNALTFETISLINPEYTVQCTSLYEMSDTVDNNSSSKYQQILGFKNFVVGYNDEYIEFYVTQDSLILKNGNAMTTSYGNNVSKDIYVDISTTEDKQDGTQEYPFKELAQAIANLSPNFNGNINIYLADGTYCSPRSYQSNPHIPNINGYKGTINIIGNTNDNTKVILKNGFLIRNSNVHLSYLTISNYNTNRAINCFNASIKVDNCIVGSFEETTTSNGIYLTDSIAEIVGSTIKYYSTGILNVNSILDFSFNTVDHCNNAIYNSHSTIRNYQSNTFTNITSNIITTDSSNINSYINGIVLYSDNTGATEIDINSLYDIGKFRFLDITIYDGNVTNVYRMPRNKTIMAHSFAHLSSALTTLYTTGFYLVRTSNNIKLDRMWQSVTTLSTGNTTYNTEFTGLKIIEVRAY